MIEWIGYRMSDFSSLKIEALRQRSLDVPRVSERQALVICIFMYEKYYLQWYIDFSEKRWLDAVSLRLKSYVSTAM
jgi:hypothetical protein